MATSSIALRLAMPAFLLGSIALVICNAHPYLPLDSGDIGMILIVGFVLLAIVVQRARVRGNARMAWLAATVPWILSLIFLANGWFDKSPEQLHTTSVIDMHFSRGYAWRSTMVVRGWRAGHKTEEIPTPFSGGFYKGESVDIGVRDGALGLPWVNTMSRTGGRP